jgi:hypothetical protein
MKAPKPSNKPETAAISSEALVGLGITLGALGLLGMLLGWAQRMRGVPDSGDSAMLWLGVGGTMVVLGVIIASASRLKKTR